MDVVPSATDSVSAVPSGFGVVWNAPDGEARISLADAANADLEHAAPVRRFTSYRGQRHFPGWYWSATTGSRVPYESWLERDHALLLDFDHRVVGFAAQPFWLHWQTDENGRKRWHAPDFFARTVDGTGVVIDCRPAELIDTQTEATFAVTRMACDIAGWVYRIAGVIDLVRAGNLRWLAGYRHPRHAGSDILAARVRSAFEVPAPLFTQAALVGEPMMVLPVAFHLLWQGSLSTDLSLPLNDRSVVSGQGRSS